MPKTNFTRLPKAYQRDARASLSRMRMIAKLAKPDARRTYRRRAITVEPVFGQIKIRTRNGSIQTPGTCSVQLGVDDDGHHPQSPEVVAAWRAAGRSLAALLRPHRNSDERRPFSARPPLPCTPRAATRRAGFVLAVALAIPAALLPQSAPASSS